MRPLYLLITICISLFSSACATHATSSSKNQPAAPTTQLSAAHPKDPLTVAMFQNGQKPSGAYKIVGTETISKFNLNGIKRQTANIHDAMRNMAAKMGGDAIINIAHEDNHVTGTVITFVNPPAISAG